MSEEDTTAPVEDEAPVTEDAAPGETEAPADPPEGFIPQDRYDNLRSEFNRKQALWDRAQQGDLEAMRELQLPVEFEDDTDQEDDVDPDNPLSTLEQRIAAQEERDRQRAEQEGVERFNADLDKLAADKDITLSKRERAALYLETLQSGGDADALKKAFGQLHEERKAYDRQVIENYVKSKKAPHVSSVGTGATDEVLPLDATHQQRVEYMTQRYEAANAE